MIGVVCAIAILSAGCKSKELEAPTPSSTQEVPAETAETEYQPEPVETNEGEVRSFYTGEWMDEKKAKSIAENIKEKLLWNYRNRELI